MKRFVPALACVVAIAAPRASFAEEPAPPAPAPAPDPATESVEKAAEPAPAPAPSPEPRRVRPRDLVIEVPGERSRNNKLLVGGLLAGGVIASALGVYWHVDSRDASNAVSADEFTGEAWTQDHIALVDRAERSKTRATIAYSIGGALLIATVATWIFTEPEGEKAVIHTGGVAVAPTGEGGTVVTKMWSF